MAFAYIRPPQHHSDVASLIHH
uniref:Uncharacterized protein n=1 Tax=Anguilla anguilla TaxID=7936 RepID=A0A0E9THQ4_ANGAN